jgi:hypothetical protein
LGNTFKLVGAGKVRGGGALPAGGGGACGAWATIAATKTAAVSSAAAAVDSDWENDFKRVVSSGNDVLSWVDESRIKKDAFTD